MSRILDKSSIKAFYINDTSNEIIDLNENGLNSFKKMNDSFNKKEINNTTDSSKKVNPDLDFYIVDTVADKEINSRTYDYDSIETSVKDKAWVFPFSKPVITNHNVGGGWFGGDANVLGRVVDSFFISHDKCKVTSKSKRDSNLPDTILKDVLDKKTGGTGSSVVKVNLNSSSVERILDGRMVSFSQGSIYHNAVCNICGHDYRDAECSHYIGEKYTTEKDGVSVTKVCVPKMSDREPMEISEVVAPANDTSIIMIHNKKTNTLLDLTNIKEEDLFEVSTDNNSQQDNKNNKIETDSKNNSENTKNFNNQEKNVKTDNNENKNKEEVKNVSTKTNDRKEAMIFKMARKNAINDLKKVLSQDKTKEIETIIDSFEQDEQYLIIDFMQTVFGEFTKDDLSNDFKVVDDSTKKVEEPITVLPNVVKEKNTKDFSEMTHQELLDYVSNKEKKNIEDTNNAFADGEKTTDTEVKNVFEDDEFLNI